MTVEDYDILLGSQDYKCAICGTTKPGGRGNFVVDHDHVTGQVRALLCSNCNVALGHFQDSPDLLRKAAEYLEQHAGTPV